MLTLPNPFTDSAAITLPASEQAVASNPPPVPDAAAPSDHQSSSSTGGSSKEAPAVEYLELPQAAGATDDICDVHEVFYFARLLVAEDNSIHRRFVLNETAFMEAIEPPPLFLQRVC